MSANRFSAGRGFFKITENAYKLKMDASRREAAISDAAPSACEKANRKSRALSGIVKVLQAADAVQPFVFVCKWQGQLPSKVSKMLPEQGPIEAGSTRLL